jgi:cardiolipin synthase
MKSKRPVRSLSKKSIQNIYGTSFTEGNEVTLVWKDRESFQSIFNAIREAQKFICLQFYIYRDDETGKELSDILKKKAGEGISVYVIYDHFGSFFTPRAFWQELKDSGVRIRASRPFRWTMPFHYVHRDHRKLIIIDGTRAFTGGINIANEYRGYHRLKKKTGWRDTGIFLEGPIVARLTNEFRKSWEIWKGEPFGPVRETKARAAGLPVLPIFSSSARSRRTLRKLLYYSINSAQESIYLTTAYFIPSRRMLHILEAAVSRGVDVKLLLPGISDVSAAYYAGRAFFSRLLRAGIEIHTFSGVILHAKTSVFDTVWSIIGSANLDFQSLRRNDEGNVGIMDRGFGEQMKEIFFHDLGRSEKITLEQWKKRPVHQKLMEHLFSLFRRRL